RPAGSFLSAILRTFNDVEIVGEAANGMEAVQVIESKRPDLALLDLQMPEVDGLGVVRLLKKNRTPLVAFVTAYDENAVRAFEVNAVDYVLKPVEAARLRRTIDRARERLEPASFIRLGRGTLVNVEMIRRIVPMPGGTFTVVLNNNEEFRVSRLQSRLLREQLLRL